MKNFTKFIIPLICGFATVMTSKANAFLINQDGCFATEVITATQGLQSSGNPISASRSDLSLALNAPDRSNEAGGFYSLGLGGTVTLQLAGAVYNHAGTDIIIYETSYSGDTCGGTDDEKALIELSQYGEEWVEYGTVCRDAHIDIEITGLDFVSQIRITDTTTGSGDGYDLDGIDAVNGCQEIPTLPCYGATAINYIPGNKNNNQPITDTERTNINKALGEPEMDESLNFLSLGYGGEVTILFDGAVYNNAGPDIKVIETTFGHSSYEDYPESADIFVSQNGVDFYYIGEILANETNELDINDAVIALDYITEVKIIDSTPEGSISADGFDLDGVIALTGCNEAPAPEEAGCYATRYLNYVEGTRKNGGVIDAIRTETPENVLGTPEGTDDYVFTTLGYGGEITLTFDGAVMNQEGDDLLFVETSFYNPTGCENDGEYADIYVSADNISYHFAGTVCKTNNKIDISDAANFEYIYYVKVVNNNELSITYDAYDLDGVVVLSTCEGFDIDTYSVHNALSIGDINTNDLELKTYPNPTTGVSYVEFTAQTSGHVLIEVYDINGRNIAEVFNKEAFSGQQYKTNFNGSNLAPGLYLYKITTGNSSITKKFIIK